MKIILLTVIVFFITNQVFTQDVIDPVKVFERESRPEAINLTNDEFIRSWNWGSPGAVLDAAMGVNWHHSMNLNPSELNYNQDNRLMQPLTHPSTVIIGGRKSIRLFQSHSLHLDPKIIVDSTSNFVPREFDSTVSVFGFMNKNKVRILNSSQNANPDYHFVMLDKDSVLSTPVVVPYRYFN